MEHSTEKTELPKRRVFHEHIILLIEGRLLMLLFIGTTGFIWYLFFRDTPALLDKAILFPICVTVLACIPLHDLVQVLWPSCSHGGRDRLEVSLYADGTAEKGGDPIYRHRLSLAGPAQKSSRRWIWHISPRRLTRRSAGTRAICCAIKRDSSYSRLARSSAVT